jgi:hypothetical protein
MRLGRRRTESARGAVAWMPATPLFRPDQYSPWMPPTSHTASVHPPGVYCLPSPSTSFRAWSPSRAAWASGLEATRTPPPEGSTPSPSPSPSPSRPGSSDPGYRGPIVANGCKQSRGQRAPDSVPDGGPVDWGTWPAGRYGQYARTCHRRGCIACSSRCGRYRCHSGQCSGRREQWRAGAIHSPPANGLAGPCQTPRQCTTGSTAQRHDPR